jgi:hypothetical protein
MLSFAPGKMHTVDCLSHGVPVRIRVGSDDLLAGLPELLPFATRINTAPEDGAASFTLLPPGRNHGYKCFAGSELVLESVEDKPVLEQFARELMIHVANFCPDRVFVHAGVVGWKGRALVMPGTSYAGKTTLTAALVRAGATYLSDEYAVVDQAGWVHPYARDLQMREPGKPGQRSMPVESLHGRATTNPMRVATVVFARYEPGADWNPQPVTAGLAVLEMLRHAIPVQRIPRRVLAALTAMLEGATAWKAERGEADDVVDSLLRSLEDAP